MSLFISSLLRSKQRMENIKFKINRNKKNEKNPKIKFMNIINVDLDINK